MLWFRPLDNSTEGFQNWEFMTTHCWGEQAAGEWTLKIQDTPSQKRDSAELGLLFLVVKSQLCETCIWSSCGKPVPAHGDRPFLSFSYHFCLFYHRSTKGVVSGDLRHRRAATPLAFPANQIGWDADGQWPHWRIRWWVTYSARFVLFPGSTTKQLNADLQWMLDAKNGTVSSVWITSHSLPWWCCDFAVFLPFQDPATQNAATMVVRGPARSTVSRVCTFFSSSRTTQGC